VVATTPAKKAAVSVVKRMLTRGRRWWREVGGVWCGEGDGDVEEQKRVWEGMEVGKRKRKLRFLFVLLSRKERAWAMTKQQHKREGGNLLQQTPDPKSSFEAK
jgi:hypothetical protein